MDDSPPQYNDLPGYNTIISPRSLGDPEKVGEHDVFSSRPATAKDRIESALNRPASAGLGILSKVSTICSECHNGFMQDRYAMWMICATIIVLFPCGLWLADKLMIRKCTTCGYEDIYDMENKEHKKYVRPETPEF